MSEERRLADVASMLVLAAAYFGAAKLGLTLAFATPSVTAVWPPTGIALAALVLGGTRLWPGVALGAFLANVSTDVPLYTASGIAVGNTLEAVVGAYLLGRVGFRPSLERLRDIFALVGLAALLSTAVSATIGVASLSLGDALADGALSAWRVWWLGDMGGDLLVASLIFVLVAHWPYRDLPGGPIEAIGLLAGLVGVGLVVFSHESPTGYVTFPFLVWAALRFLQPGATVATFVVAALAIAFTANDTGPFVRSSQDDSLLLAQSFSAVTGLTALILAALTSQRRIAERRARRLAGDLQAELLPPSLPEVPQFEVAGWYRAGMREQEAGGDFYDLFEADPGHWIAAIGDVCGKGPEAASLTALARYTLRAVARRAGGPSAALQALNGAILEQRSDHRFVTAVLARVAVSEDDHAVILSNGGHPMPLVVRADGEVVDVGEPGTLLGIYSNPRLADHRIELLPEESLVFFTDGLTERRDRAGDGRARVHALLSERDGETTASDVAARLQRVVLSDAGVADDDVAVLVLRRLPARAVCDQEPAKRVITRELAPRLEAPREARAALAPLEPELEVEAFSDLRLLVSELVTNSVRHGGLEAGDLIHLSVVVEGDLLRVEATDPGPGFQAASPQPLRDLSGGWGLYLIEQLADRWGVERHGARTTVWFERDLPRSPGSGST